MTRLSRLTCTARPMLKKSPFLVTGGCLPRNRLRNGPELPRTRAGPSLRAGAGSFPPLRSFSWREARQTGTSGPARKGADR